MKVTWLLIVAMFTLAIPVAWSARLPPEHFKAKYVPWGIDEYELISLTTDELPNKFKGKLRFIEGCRHAYFAKDGSQGPQFLLDISNGHVLSVQRLFIDGEGCNITGPVLTSKKEALKFSIDGLSKLAGGGDKQDHERLLSAQRLLKKLEQSQAEPDQHKGSKTPSR
jgi:hypothetical protein